jgi:hypothetical protein
MTTYRGQIDIPAKEWNSMKGKMEDTSLPEWQQYYKDLKEFQESMYTKEPKREQFGWNNGWHSEEQERDYHKAYSEWDMALSCDAPNKPGYYRANND